MREPPLPEEAAAQLQIDRQAQTIAEFQRELSRPKVVQPRFGSVWFGIGGILVFLSLSSLTESGGVLGGCFALAGGLTCCVLGYLSLICQRLDCYR